MNKLWEHSQDSFHHQSRPAGWSAAVHTAHLRAQMWSKPAQTAVKGCQNAARRLQVYLSSAPTRREVQTRAGTFAFGEGFDCASLKHCDQSWRCGVSDPEHPFKCSWRCCVECWWLQAPHQSEHRETNVVFQPKGCHSYWGTFRTCVNAVWFSLQVTAALIWVSATPSVFFF